MVVDKVYNWVTDQTRSDTPLNDDDYGKDDDE